MQRINSLLITCIVTLVSSTTTTAAVSRSALTSRVRARVETVLQQRIANARQEKLDGAEERIHKVSLRLVGPISAMKMEQVDDDVATWIQESVAALVANRTDVLLEDTPKAERLLVAIDGNLREQLSNATPEKMRALLKKRDELLAVTAIFRTSMQKYIVSKFSRAMSIDVDMGTKVYSNSAIGIPAFFIAMRIPVTPKESEKEKIVVDLRSKELESQILSLSLTYEVQRLMAAQADTNAFSYGNFASSIFKDGMIAGKADLKEFDTLLPLLDKMWEEMFTLDSKGVLHFKEDSIDEFIYRSDVLRLDEKIAPNSPPRTHNSSSPSVKVVFRNNVEVWKLIKP